MRFSFFTSRFFSSRSFTPRFSAALFVAAFLFANHNSRAFAQPKLEIAEGTKHSWGSVTDVKNPLFKRFTIKNTGTEELVISDVRSTCSCTTAPIDKDHIAPGDSTFLNVRLDIGEYYGDVRQSTSITSNSATGPTTGIELHAMIQRPILPSSSFFGMQQMYVGKPTTSAPLKLRNTLDVPVTITSIGSATNVNSNYKRPVTIPPHGEIDLTATVTPVESQVGFLRSQMVLKTNHPSQPVFAINIFGDVKSAAEIPANLQPATNGSTSQQKTKKSRKKATSASSQQ